MDYLNYGKQVQQKPQGFGQQKVELNSNNVQTTPTPIIEIVSLSGPIEKIKINIDIKKKMIFVKIS